MSKNLEQITNPNPALLGGYELNGEGFVDMQREIFVTHLTAAGQLSPEAVEEGLLENFAYNRKTDYDAAVHILIGDSKGGCHHIPSTISSGLQGDRIIASSYPAARAAEPGAKSEGHYRRRQRIDSQGVSHPGIIELPGEEPGEPNVEKNGGGAMFPNEWTGEQVLRAAVSVADGPGEFNEETGSTIHKGEVEGVRVMVATRPDPYNPDVNKIITAVPRHKK